MSAQSVRKTPEHPRPPRNRRTAITQTVIGFSSRSRRVISEHRQRRKLRDKEVSDRSRRGLDWTNFFIANVQTSFGSFLAFYLADLGWGKQEVGLALTAGALAGVGAQIPGGALADAVRWKRGLVAVGVVAIAASALILALHPSFTLVFVAETLHGVTGGIVGPTIAAISLGLAGRHGMSCRVGRNFRFAAAGNAVTALAMGALGVYASVSAIFVVTALLCIPALIALDQIRPDEIDYVRARNAARRDHSLELQRIADLGKNRNLLVFAGTMVLFQLSNASMLPLVGENLALSKLALSPLFMAGLIVVPQIVVAVLAPWIGYWSELWGRKPLLLVGFGTEAARGLLFSVVSEPWVMILVQLLDGVTGAVITVLTILVITDLTTGTGRFNLAQGAIATMQAIGASLSGLFAGEIVDHLGYSAAFLALGAAALLALIVFAAGMPETARRD